MLKGFNELVQIDVLPFCDKRKAKDDNGSRLKFRIFRGRNVKCCFTKTGRARSTLCR